jgi:hypothetical protein
MQQQQQQQLVLSKGGDSAACQLQLAAALLLDCVSVCLLATGYVGVGSNGHAGWAATCKLACLSTADSAKQRTIADGALVHRLLTVLALT